MSDFKEEKLFEQEYDLGEGDRILFTLFRSEEGDDVTVTLKYNFPGNDMDMVTCKRIFFKKDAESYQSQYLSWYNLICCSNNYGPIPVVDYLNRSVIEGKKVAATIYPKSSSEYMKLVSEMGDGYYCYPYQPKEYAYLLYVSKKGTLSEYFDLDAILDVYRSCGVNLDQEKMKEYFGQELSYFGNEDLCSIELHNCLGEAELAVTGLLFGYPIESTIALIRKEIDLCEG